AGRRLHCRTADGRCRPPDRHGSTRDPQSKLHQAGTTALHQRGRTGLRQRRVRAHAGARLRTGGLDGFAARKKAARKKGLLYGRGLTSYIEWTGGRAHTEKVSLHATAEGRVILHSGTQAMGQGLQTTYTQMVAASLGLAIDKIDVVQGDTDLATGFGSVGSRSLFVGGTAVAVSANDLIAKAREKASNLLEAAVEDIEYRDGWLTVVGTDKRIGLFEVARKETGARLSVDSQGEVDGPS